MAKWEQREALRDAERRKENVSLLRDRLSHEDGKVRKQQAEQTAREAVHKGIGNRD